MNRQSTTTHLISKEPPVEFSLLLQTSVMATILALLAGLIIVMTKQWHGKLTLDQDVGVQKVHLHPTPRVGGIAVAAGCVGSWWLLKDHGLALWGLILLACIPAFGAGLLEDITKKVSPKWRLLATFLSGIAFFMLTGYGIDRTGWTPIQFLLDNWVGVVFVSAFLVAAMANATNIIDGFHGLASGSVILMSAGLGAIAWKVGDVELAQIAFLFSASVFGFFLVNFPWGKLFFGDGGAYGCGAILAILGIALIARNFEVSPWALVVCFAYPAVETGFSIWRKWKRAGHSPMQPDGVHFHKLMSRAKARPLANRLGKPHLTNPLTSLYIWPIAAMGPIAAYLFSHRSLAALGAMILVAILYLLIYQNISLQRAINRTRKMQKQHHMSSKTSAKGTDHDHQNTGL